jgi:predicted RNA-binding Zn-ribbon protein involved in translation (DUF1610 family)
VPNDPLVSHARSPSRKTVDSFVSSHPCILCGATADRRRPDPDHDLYEYDCPDCGQYAARHAGVLFWPMALDSDRRAQIVAIKQENRNGRRPMI